MQRNYINILSLLMLSFMLCLTSCKGIKDISLTSVQLESVSPVGFKSVDVYLNVGVDNPAKQVKITDIDGSVKYSGKVIGKLAMDPVILIARSSEVYKLKANVSIAKGAGLKDIIMVFASPDGLEGCTVDVTAKATYGKNMTMPIKVNDIPLKELLDKIENEKN